MRPKVEIILIRFNNKEVEDKAIREIENNTDYPYQLTVYDNYPENRPLSSLWNDLIDKDCYHGVFVANLSQKVQFLKHRF